MALSIIANDDKKVTCPICWEETTVGQLKALYEAAVDLTPVKVFSILTGTNFTELMQSNREDLDAAIYQYTSFFYNQKQTFREKEVPAAIKLRGRLIMIPKKIASLSIAQNFYMRQVLSKAPCLEAEIAMAVAVFLQPMISEDGKFDVDQVKQLEAEILTMNVYDIFPTGFFLLKRLNDSGSIGIRFWLARTLQKIKRWLRSQKRPASRDLTRSTNYQ